jgi:hypothetical protein
VPTGATATGSLSAGAWSPLARGRGLPLAVLPGPGKCSASSSDPGLTPDRPAGACARARAHRDAPRAHCQTASHTGSHGDGGNFEARLGYRDVRLDVKAGSMMRLGSRGARPLRLARAACSVRVTSRY